MPRAFTNKEVSVDSVPRFCCLPSSDVSTSRHHKPRRFSLGPNAIKVEAKFSRSQYASQLIKRREKKENCAPQAWPSPSSDTADEADPWTGKPPESSGSSWLLKWLMLVPDWADAQKESGMPQRQQRAFYSHEDWLRHRSSLRHMRHLFSSLSSRVILSLIPPVFIVTTNAAVIATYNLTVASGSLPSFLPILHAASLPYELTAPALALLLVFRTDASYSRYDEARKTWTVVLSSSKDFARQSMQFINHPNDLTLKSALLKYIMAFPVALKCHLIHGSDMRGDLTNCLDEEDLDFVLSSRHRPNCLIQLMSQAVALAQLQDSQRILLDAHVAQFTLSVSVCERLIRTPIPLSYTRLTSRFLVLWHLTLPVILWDACNWLAVPATFVSSATLFCIEEVGVLIEEPFPMLALDKMCGIAHENILELLSLHRHTEKHLKSKTEQHRDNPVNGSGRKDFAHGPKT